MVLADFMSDLGFLVVCGSLGVFIVSKDVLEFCSLWVVYGFWHLSGWFFIFLVSMGSLVVFVVVGVIWGSSSLWAG